MPRTPKRAGKKAPPGARYPSEAVSDNVRSYRTLRRLTQADLAERMGKLGHDGWYHQTVGEVERGGRSVNVDELVGLALSLKCTLGDLLDPTGPEGTEATGLYVGDVGLRSEGKRHVPAPIPAPVARLLARSKTRIGFDGKALSVAIEPGPHFEEVVKAIGRPVRSRRKKR